MREDERVWSVRDLLNDYLKSPHFVTSGSPFSLARKPARGLGRRMLNNA
jgi:hypothetical protein